MSIVMGIVLGTAAHGDGHGPLLIAYDAASSLQRRRGSLVAMSCFDGEVFVVDAGRRPTFDRLGLRIRAPKP